MKTYQAQVSYKVIHPQAKDAVWTDDNKYPTIKQAQQIVDATITSFCKQYKINYGEVIEGEQDDTLVMEGFVSDNGCEYEDYALTIQPTEGWSKLIESEIGNNYKGRRVRITVELID